MAERKMTLRQAAKIAGVSASTIDDWRSGTTPADYIGVRNLANELGISFEFLLTGQKPIANHQIMSIAEAFQDGGALFDGYAKITIQRLIPRKKDL